MRHYLLVGDDEEVLGVWEAPDRAAADRLRLRLSLTYPGCQTRVEDADDYESFKSRQRDYDLSNIELLSA